MSNPNYIYPEVSEKDWEQYLQQCRALEIKPSLSDFSVYLQDLDRDEDEI